MTSARSWLAGKLRARVRPAGDLLAFVSGDLAIMEAYDEDEIPWWRVRPLRRVTNQPCPPELRVDLAIESDGAPLGNFILPDAEGLTPEPMAFASSADAADRLTLVARGSHTTRLPHLVIGVPQQCAPMFNIISGSIQPLGYARGLDLELYRLEGELRLDRDGQTFRWRTGAERETLAALEIDGATEPAVRGLAWKQPLRLSVREGTYRRQVRNNEVRWRSVRGGPWRSWPEASPRGDVTFVLIRDGFTVSRTTAAIAPSGFSTSAVSGPRRSLAIMGLQGAAATIDGTVTATTLKGLSPYPRNGRHLAAMPITLPDHPFPFLIHPSGAAAAMLEVKTFLASDPEVSSLRDFGVWTEYHDRAALFTPYFRSAEHSAQQPSKRLRSYEDMFKTGDINVLNCSTTMEMGVDIGSIELVINSNVPPSIASYRQRVGRAGTAGSTDCSRADDLQGKTARPAGV